MLDYVVTGDVSKITRHLSDLSRRQVPFATASALTKTAKFVQQKIKEEIPRVFDRPTRFTLNSTWVRPATKARLWAEVKIKDEVARAVPPIRWLAPQIYGGSRGPKGFEKALLRMGKMPPGYAVPASSMPRDAYGNVSKGQIVKILADLQALRDPLDRATPKSRLKRRRSRTKRAQFYFSTYPVNWRTAHLKPGIYVRTEFGFGSSIRPVMLFVPAVRYRKRLRFYEIADQSARMRFPIEFALAMRHAIRTART